jgi:ribosomal protein S18 acetylase RimI-like enzyme
MAVTPPFVVRRLHPEDAAAVQELARGLGKWFDAEGLARIARDLGAHAGYVAVQGGRVVGFVTWTPVSADTAELSWMGVEVDLQHHGIGTALLAVLVADLGSSGFHSLEVSTVADSVDYEPYAETRRFYRSRGFADFRVDPRYWGSGEDRYDRLVLRRELSA